MTSSATTGSSKMIFLESLINDEQDKKNFRIGFVVCQQFTFKIRRFRFTAAQTEARERMTSKEKLTPSGLSRFQLFTRPEQTTVQAFQGLS